ncbi:MAG: hypothetical protein GX444_10605 [Myxococcales bacterium]|nr:hypothetical protein [Myxococcales bacterium]
MRYGWWLIVLMVAIGFTLPAWAEDSGGSQGQEGGDNPPAATPVPPPVPPAVPGDPQLAAKIAELEKQIQELEKRLDNPNPKPARIGKLDWEKDREGFALPNGWYVTCHGEFRSRALVEANTLNGYTNFAGERVYAYNPKSTLANDYGWWDQRFQMRTVFNFGSTADLIIMLQLGDIVWGSHAPVLGYTARHQQKFDQVDLFFRELYTRINLDPIPMYLVFGHMPVNLGNRLIMGNEHDGAYTYFGPKWLEFGAGAVRQYEGENYEMSMRTNDDEDTFFGWINSRMTDDHFLSVFGWANDWKVTRYPNRPDPDSPLFKLPAFTQEKYTSQDSQQWDVGANYVGRFGPVTVNAEIDQQFGRIIANDDVPDVEDINFKGNAAFLKTDYKIDDKDTVALSLGYGSGDDPKTVDYEGFFAPDNDFGIRDEYMDEYIQRGYFSVYEHLAPGAGVPGHLRDNWGTGGLENTIFANLGADLGFQDNHHYYVSWGYLRAARPNPETDDAEIGWEMDARVDYLFSNNVVFSIYGGHLFMTGEYFRPDAHDAAQVYFEWKLVW